MIDGEMLAPILEDEAKGTTSSTKDAAPPRAAAHPSQTSVPMPPRESVSVRALIYQPCRSTMSSGGKASAQPWVLEFESRSPSLPDPLMGWSSSIDTLAQVQLNFPSREAAIAYARRSGLATTVIEPQRYKRVIRSYASNFVGEGAVGVSGRVTQPQYS